MERRYRNGHMDVNITREWIKLFLGIVLAFFGMATIAFGLIAPPVGAIDYSVVTTFGGILTWVGSMFGIDSNAKIKLHQQDMNFEIKNRELEEKMRRFDRKYGPVDEDLDVED